MMFVRSRSARNRPARGQRRDRIRPERRRRRSPLPCCAPASPSPATWCGSATSSTMPAASAQIAIYRAPDLGTTGSLPTAKVIAALQAHQVIGVDTRDIKAVSVTRLSRSHRGQRNPAPGRPRAGTPQRPRRCRQSQPDLRSRRAGYPARRLEHRPAAAGLDPIRAAQRPLRRQLRDRQRQQRGAGQAALYRHRDRNRGSRGADAQRRTQRGPEILRRDDRAPPESRSRQRSPPRRGQVVGMQMRRQLRAGQALRVADLAKPDLVQRDDNVTLIYESAGLYLTIRGKALDSGTEGDIVSVLNLQSKRTISGVVIGRGPGRDLRSQRRGFRAAADPLHGRVGRHRAPVSVAASNSSPVAPKAE